MEYDKLLSMSFRILITREALLATEQRIPGLGNGVLQDILFNSGIHPKRKKSTLTDFEKSELFHLLEWFYKIFSFSLVLV